MDFFTVKNRIVNREFYEKGKHFGEDVKLAIQDECGFDEKQALWIFEKVKEDWDDGWTVLDNPMYDMQKLAYSLREFLNLGE